MPFSLIKAIKSTDRNPVNVILHLIGLPAYASGITLIAGYFLNLDTTPVTGLILWLVAVCFFLTGHKIEGNLRAMTLMILFKYLKSKKPKTKTSPILNIIICYEYNNNLL